MPPKTIAGKEFEGTEELIYDDIQDFIVTGMGEAVKSTLDELDWDGECVASVVLNLSTNNKKVDSGKINMAGELMKTTREFKAVKLFENAEKDLRVTFQIEESGLFKFNNGMMVGDLLDCSEFPMSVEKKNTGRAPVVVEETDYSIHNISSFCVRPYLVPVSGRKAKLTILAYPLSKDELTTEHPLSNKAAFPGMELGTMEINLFPVTNTDISKDWGSPIYPLFLLGGNESEHPNIPPTVDIRRKISNIMRTATKPQSKRNIQALQAAWGVIKSSGPSKLREKQPDLIWPAVGPSPTQVGMYKPSHKGHAYSTSEILSLKREFQ